MRIVSLLPSATEILYALGLEDEIVGVSRDCQYPPQLRSKPLASRSSVSEQGSSGAIAAAIEQAYHSGNSLYHLDPDFLRRTQPDLIIAQELCQVCAITSSQARAMIEQIRDSTPVLSMEPKRLQEVVDSVRRLAKATDREAQGQRLAGEMQQKIDRVRAATDGPTLRPRVVCLGWIDPIIVEGHWIPDLVHLAGGHDVMGEPGAHSRRVHWSEVVAARPEVLIVSPCSFDARRTLAEIAILQAQPGWTEIPAVQSGRVFVVDSAYTSSAAPRLLDGLVIFARAISPERTAFRVPPGSVAKLASHHEDYTPNGSFAWYT